jgi:hypothetical protein
VASDYQTCPKCGQETLGLGYGLAGGGMGAYTYCVNDDCAFFDKTQDHDEDPPRSPSTEGAP